MNLSGIISVAGMSGLYKVVANSKSGLIVESLVDKKRIPTYANQRVSSLDEISMYTTDKDVPLKDVFEKIKEKHNGGASIDHKSADDVLKKYFTEILPAYDKDRVYTSDIKKVISWYNILQANDMLKEEEKKEATDKPLVKSADEKAKTHAKPVKEKKVAAPKSAGVKKAAGVRKTGAA